MNALPAMTVPRLRRLPVAVLSIGVIAVGVYFLLPLRAELFAYVAIECASVLVALWCARRLPARERGGWLWLIAGMTAFTLADGLFNGFQLVTGHPTGFPSLADPVYLLGYPLLTAGVAVVITRTGLRFTQHTALDTGIVIVLAASLQWALAGSASSMTPGTAILLAYTVGDALLVALVVRALLDPVGRRPSDVLLLGAAAALWGADILYAISPDTYHIGTWFDSGWLMSQVLLATAAAAALSEPRRREVSPLERTRRSQLGLLVILGTALLIPPAAFVWFAAHHDLRDRAALVLAGASVVLTALVFARLALLVRDMSAARRSERDARRGAEQAAARLGSLVSQSPSGILVEDAARRIALVNARFCEIFGIDAAPDGLSGADCAVLVERAMAVAADPEDFAAQIAARLDARVTALSDVVRFADGRIFERDYVPINLGDENTGALWQYREVTERIRLEESLRASEARNAATIATALDAVVWMDAESRVVEFNPAAEAMFGFSREYAMGRQLAHLIIPERLRAAHARGVARVLAGGASDVLGARLEMVALHADGHEFPVELAISAIEGEESALFTAFMRDISDRRRAERALADARDEALRAAEAKSEFLATMSHEIRTPMYGVIGTLDLLRLTDLDREQRDLVRVMHDSARGLVEIINEVLDFSKLEAGKVQLADDPFCLRDVVESVAELLGPEARQKGLRLATHVAGEIPERVLGDAGRLRQVLLNLVGNAVKFTDHGDVVLRVTADAADGARTRVHIEVIDTGPGIPRDRLEEIFQPFAQVQAARVGAQAGTGLGLAISQRLVEAMDGTIHCTSAEGVGTTLSVRLPLRPAAAPPPRPNGARLTGLAVALDLRPGPAAAALADTLADLGAHIVPLTAPGCEEAALVISDDPSRAHGVPVLLLDPGGFHGEAVRGRPVTGVPVRSERLAEAVACAAGRGAAPATRPAVAGAGRTAASGAARPGTDDGGRRVLLVEDNDVNRALAARQLERLGYATHAVASGPEAIAAVAAGQYGVVLMDCRMPGMDGFAATRRIRAREAAGRRVPIIAVTADGRPEDRAACLEAGMDDHVAKPLTMGDLARVLGRWLPPGGHAPGGAPDGPPATASAGPVGIPVLVDQIGREETARLFRTWREETPRRLAAIRDGLAHADPAAVAAAAHVLKSTCGLFGAADAAKTAARAEALARDGASGELPSVCLQLEDEIQRATSDLELALGVSA